MNLPKLLLLPLSCLLACGDGAPDDEPIGGDVEVGADTSADPEPSCTDDDVTARFVVRNRFTRYSHQTLGEVGGEILSSPRVDRFAAVAAEGDCVVMRGDDHAVSGGIVWFPNECDELGRCRAIGSELAGGLLRVRGTSHPFNVQQDMANVYADSTQTYLHDAGDEISLAIVSGESTLALTGLGIHTIPGVANLPDPTLVNGFVVSWPPIVTDSLDMTFRLWAEEGPPTYLECTVPADQGSVAVSDSMIQELQSEVGSPIQPHFPSLTLRRRTLEETPSGCAALDVESVRELEINYGSPLGG